MRSGLDVCQPVSLPLATGHCLLPVCLPSADVWLVGKMTPKKTLTCMTSCQGRFLPGYTIPISGAVSWLVYRPTVLVLATSSSTGSRPIIVNHLTSAKRTHN